MLCQKLFLIRFISICCFIFLFFSNFFVTAEAGMGLGKVCFYKDAESDKEPMEKTVSLDIKSCYFDVKFLPKDRNPDDKNKIIDKIIDQFKTETNKTKVKSDGNPEDRIVDQSKIDADIPDFLSILEKKCGALLIVGATGSSEKWTLAIFDDVRFDDAREFRTIIIDDPSHALSEELKKEPLDKSRIKELAASSLDRALFVKEEGKIKIVERKQDNSYTISRGKIETESMYIVNCNIEQKCNEKDCPQGVIQLVRQEWESCYKYKLFLYPGEYDIKCDQCKTNVTINHGSLSQDINFYYSSNKHSDKSFCN